jgi:glycosyltransferase involved in cell wall biosynthesis
MNSIEKYPLVTIGMIVLNRDWIIEHTIKSILNQNYPKNKLYLIVIDGGSTDQTVYIINKILMNSSLYKFQIIVKNSNIPEARNICIKNMEGSYLFFWDSDVIMKDDYLKTFINTISKFNGHILHGSGVNRYLNSIDDLIDVINEYYNKILNIKQKIIDVRKVGMGHTLIKKEVFNDIMFDENLLFMEDLDFSLKAYSLGYKVQINPTLNVLDIDLPKIKYSDIYSQISLLKHLKVLKKTIKIRLLSYNEKWNIKKSIQFLISTKNDLFYISNLIMLFVSIFGLFYNILLTYSFFVYLMIFIIYKIKKMGYKIGFRSGIKSIIIGIPRAILTIYYLSLLSFYKNNLSIKNYLND